MSTQHLSLLHLSSPQSTWELVILTYFPSLYDCSAQPLSEPFPLKQQQGKEQRAGTLAQQLELRPTRI